MWRRWCAIYIDFLALAGFFCLFPGGYHFLRKSSCIINDITQHLVVENVSAMMVLKLR